jgi:hypothetical protein
VAAGGGANAAINDHLPAGASEKAPHALFYTCVFCCEPLALYPALIIRCVCLFLGNPSFAPPLSQWKTSRLNIYNIFMTLDHQRRRRSLTKKNMNNDGGLHFYTSTAMEEIWSVYQTFYELCRPICI